MKLKVPGGVTCCADCSKTTSFLFLSTVYDRVVICTVCGKKTIAKSEPGIVPIDEDTRLLK